MHGWFICYRKPKRKIPKRRGIFFLSSEHLHQKAKKQTPKKVFLGAERDGFGISWTADRSRWRKLNTPNFSIDYEFMKI
jgi:hypothetical protein